MHQRSGSGSCAKCKLRGTLILKLSLSKGKVVVGLITCISCTF